MTKYLLDTNILLRASDPASKHYSLAVDSVASLIEKGHECVITAQVLIEFWVVATRPLDVNGLGWSVEQTNNKIDLLINQFTLIKETESVFSYWLELVTKYQIKGKRTHDARLMAVAIASFVTHVLTFNVRDFAKIEALIIVHPSQVQTLEAEN